MNVLGVIFNSKLNWNDHTAKAINKANSALHCIKLIKYYFNKEELLNIITSNYYSILYYNSEIWHIPLNTHNSKKQIMSASAAPLKYCVRFYDRNISYITLHAIVKRATPSQIMIYKHALLLHKIYNDENSSQEWLSLFFNQTLLITVHSKLAKT